MKEKDKYKKTSRPAFLRYREGKMTNSERNAFERELQKDPFEMEAEEGFSITDPGALREDMELLDRTLRSRTKNSARYMFYRIVASIAILMVISTVFYMVQRNSPSEIEKVSESKPDVLAVKEEPATNPENEMKSPAVPATAQRIEPEKNAVAVTDVKTEKSKLVKIVPVADADSTKADGRVNAEKVNELITADEIIVKTDSVIKAVAEPEAAVQLQNIPAGYGEKKSRPVETAPVTRSETISDAARVRHIAPEPLNGFDNFYKYIEENIRRPEGAQPGKDSVIMSFIVRIKGNPDNIKIIESPGKAYSDEAIRLIKKGPLWKPASENGTIKEEEVRLKIVFK